MSFWKQKEQRVVRKIESQREKLMALSDIELQRKTAEFQKRREKGESLDKLLPEVFAVVREASRRVTGMEHYPVQLLGGIALHQGKIAEMKTGEGKANPVYTPIPTPDGWKTVGDIRVGDLLFDKHGNPTKVTGVFPQGKKEIYEVELKDGRVVESAPEHLWSVFKQYHDNEKVMTTEELYREGICGNRGYRWMIPMNDCVSYSEQLLDLDPYVMGAFLGNGCKNKAKVFEFSSMDEDVVAEIAAILAVDFVKSHSKTYTWHFYENYDENALQNRRYKVEDVAPQYVDLLTQSYAHEKYIPMEYKIGSVEQRFALLQGLFDTDGNIYEDHEGGQKRYNIHFSTTSAQLRDDVLEVLYSLGLQGSWSYGKRAGNGVATHDQYVVCVHVRHDDKSNLFRLSRKKCVAEKAAKDTPKRRNYERVSIVDIRKTNRTAEQVCFTVDNSEHLFLIDKYVVTHNTIVAALPSYLHALDKKGVHVVTVNEYLAQRDAEEIGAIHQFLGLTVGCITSKSTLLEKKDAYGCDITYITNSELGFDYLRDNMAMKPEQQVQRGLHYCIIDEVDSILIDEARTPLIISGASSQSMELYGLCNYFVQKLEKGESSGELTKLDIMNGTQVVETGDYIVNEKEKQVYLTERGVQKTEAFFKLKNYSADENVEIQHHMMLALKAHNLMKREVDYIVRDGEVLIVDEFTGRIMDGRRYSDGLHQAIEAKEGVEIQKESQTLATITYQNFFNKYDLKSGMTGTAMTESKEFRDIYQLDVVSIPTNKPVIRVDDVDNVYLTKQAKYQAIVDAVKKYHAKQQPVLVGTVSVEVSELLSQMLQKEGLSHQVLNAKYHAKEAEIVANAGIHGTITIATNMAGRGTDIKLDAEAKAAGGLVIIGTERHESRRIDNQLRGRSGRQGDPGLSRFYLSLEDDVMRLFGNEKTIELVKRMGYDEQDVLRHKSLSKTIETAQRKIEGNHYGMRKNLLDFDLVNNQQRESIYAQRQRILCHQNMRCMVQEMLWNVSEDVVVQFLHGNHMTEESYQNICEDLRHLLPYELELRFEKDPKKQVRLVREELGRQYQIKEQEFSDEDMREIERVVLLRVMDSHWLRHLNDLEQLRQGIGLVGYAQRDPVVEYKTKAYELYETMLAGIERETIRMIFKSRIVRKATEDEKKNNA